MANRYLGMPLLMDVARVVNVVPWAWRGLAGRPKQFSHDGKSFEYFSHPYNATWRNERAIEIPLIMSHVTAFAPEAVLEVGNVLSHYFPTRHLVVDKYERRPGVAAEDIVGFDPRQRFQRIVSISTLEHIGWDELPRVPGKYWPAIDTMRRLLSADGLLLATIPLGYNPQLDQDIFAVRLGCSRVDYFKRLSRGEWRVGSLDEALGARYGERFRTADGLALCTWLAAP